MDLKIVPVNSDNINQCFSFWDFEKDEFKKKKLLYEIKNGQREMYACIKKDKYIAGFSIKYINEKQIYLAYLSVNKSFQNQGIGSCIIDFVSQHAISSGRREILLEVDTDNINARRLYERKGFVKIRNESSARILLIKPL